MVICENVRYFADMKNSKFCYIDYFYDLYKNSADFFAAFICD